MGPKWEPQKFLLSVPQGGVSEFWKPERDYGMHGPLKRKGLSAMNISLIN